MPATYPTINRPVSAGALVPGVSDWTDPGQVAGAAGATASNLGATGAGLVGQGQAALGPVLQQLMQIIQGNQTAVDTALAPQESSIISQYDTARRAIANFTPRGGGQTSALAGSRIAEAGKISDLRSSARTSAIGELASIGGTELSAGTSLESTGLQGLLASLQSAITERGQNLSFFGDLGKGIGSILGAWIGRL